MVPSPQPLVCGQQIFQLHGFRLRDRCQLNPGETSPTPEPGTFGLVGVGMLGLGLLARRRPQLRFN